MRAVTSCSALVLLAQSILLTGVIRGLSKVITLSGFRCISYSIDHGRSDELGCWGELEKIARFEKLKNFCRVFQNDIAFLGRIGKPSLSEFPEIYG